MISSYQCWHPQRSCSRDLTPFLSQNLGVTKTWTYGSGLDTWDPAKDAPWKRWSTEYLTALRERGIGATEMTSHQPSLLETLSSSVLTIETAQNGHSESWNSYFRERMKWYELSSCAPVSRISRDLCNTSILWSCRATNAMYSRPSSTPKRHSFVQEGMQLPLQISGFKRTFRTNRNVKACFVLYALILNLLDWILG